MAKQSQAKRAGVALIAAYYADVSPHDLEGRDPEVIAGCVAAHRGLATDRAAQQALVRVWTPSAETDGWSLGRTVVDVLTDDMPYVVDSVLAELTRQRRAIRLIAHPIITVQRDETGHLQEAPVSDGTVEAWVHVEIDRIPEQADRLALQERLLAVLADVRAVWEDDALLKQRAAEVAATLPPGEEPDLLAWMAEHDPALLGYARIADGAVQESLGLLRGSRPEPDGAPEGLLSIQRASRRSTVQRAIFPEVVTLQIGEIEHRFTGLLSAVAQIDSVLNVPVVRAKARHVLQHAGYASDSHSGRDLLAILESYPSSEVFQSSLSDLEHVTREVLLLGERRLLRMFLRRDEAGRFMSCLVYLPRDLYTRNVRHRIQEVLGEEFAAESVDYTAMVTESVLARLLFVVHAPDGEQVPDVDPAILEQRLAQVARSWSDDLAEFLQSRLSERHADALLAQWPNAFPAAYQADFTPEIAARDLLRLSRMTTGLTMTLYRPPGVAVTELRLSILSEDKLSLSAALPVLQHMAVEVVDSRPYDLVSAGGRVVHLYDIGLRAVGDLYDAEDGLDTLFRDAFTAVWTGAAEDDGYNALVLRGGLGWRQVAVLRAYGAYLRQSAWTFSPEYVESCLIGQVEICRLLTELFQARFEPDPSLQMSERRDLVHQITARALAAIDEVAGADEDRILRAFLSTILGTVRTNAYRRDESGAPREYLSFKLDPHHIPELPAPRPRHEVWVHSPRVEGVHLRFGAVARGGLRWSDRREDFRTEVLGLVKAQTVKNAVIVPVGAKGCFVGKQLPPMTERDAWLAEGIACYRSFIRGMLDVTDNRDAGEIVPPDRVVRWDEDDPYLVVAADKGTATFSDIANGVAQQEGFWLDDAFASGGSAGYDHKAMGITARGAWLSVRRHFAELGIDTQAQDITVAGIGDMSGDVFGNGMLLSEHIRLVAAFDHRHVFLDPNPDAATSYAERRRLAALARSCWEDYDSTLISDGGGVYPRTAKSIPISPQVRARLGLPEGTDKLSPPQLLTAILKAPVDLIWNGAIGTYVKASTETHAEAGDRANDGVRINGDELRCRVIGEGGNLGLTQRGRIEASRHGVRLNTDAIDNAAGVDCSDHEVNIKILLAGCVRDGSLSADERDPLLASMTEDVAASVLGHNRSQNLTLSISRTQAPALLSVHRRMMSALEESGTLDRAIEALPTPRELDARAAADEGLASPELAVMLAYAKITMKTALLAQDLADEPWTVPWLLRAFPTVLVERYEQQILAHPLRAEIVATMVTNEVADAGGTTFAFRLREETGASTKEIVQAYAVATHIFHLPGLSADIEDAPIPTDLKIELHLHMRRMLDRTARWFLHHRRGGLDVLAERERFGQTLSRLLPAVPSLVRGTEETTLSEQAAEWQERGVPEGIAQQLAALLHAFPLLHVIDLDSGVPARELAALHYAVAADLGVDRLLERISALPRAERWAGQARAALREDTYDALTQITADVLTSTEPAPPSERIWAWRASHQRQLRLAFERLEQIAAEDASDLATLTVAVRTFRSLIPA